MSGLEPAFLSACTKMVSSARGRIEGAAAHQLSVLLRSLVARVQRLFEELRQLAQRLRLWTPGHDV